MAKKTNQPLQDQRVEVRVRGVLRQLTKDTEPTDTMHRMLLPDNALFMSTSGKYHLIIDENDIISKSENVFDAKAVRKYWEELRPVWEPYAMKAVDEAFRLNAQAFKMKNTKTGWKNAHKEALESLESGIWEQDMTWDYSDKAYLAMAKKLGMEPDVDIDLDPLSSVHTFGDAWNDFTRDYALKIYGIDINFDQVIEMKKRRRN